MLVEKGPRAGGRLQGQDAGAGASGNSGSSSVTVRLREGTPQPDDPSMWLSAPASAKFHFWISEPPWWSRVQGVATL